MSDVITTLEYLRLFFARFLLLSCFEFSAILNAFVVSLFSGSNIMCFYRKEQQYVKFAKRSVSSERYNHNY